MHGSSAARAARRPTPLAVPPPPHRTRENTRPRQSREEERLGPRAEAASAPADCGAEAPKPAGKSRERLGGEVKTGRQERVGMVRPVARCKAGAKQTGHPSKKLRGRTRSPRGNGCEDTRQAGGAGVGGAGGSPPRERGPARRDACAGPATSRCTSPRGRGLTRPWAPPRVLATPK